VIAAVAFTLVLSCLFAYVATVALVWWLDTHGATDDR
jgi:hypothetical protein